MVSQHPADRSEDDAARFPVALKVSGGTLKSLGVIRIAVYGH
jgi:hypothetical protein